MYFFNLTNIDLIFFPTFQITAITWIIGSLLMAINIYYLSSGFIDFLLHSNLKLVAAVFIVIVGFSGMLLYMGGIGYLVFRKNKKAMHLLALTTAENGELVNDAGNASVYSLPREDIVSMQLPQRRVTADVN